MKSATLEQLRDITSMAEEKLSAYKIHTSSEDYEKTLAMAIREIANDMGLEVPDDLTATESDSTREAQLFEIRDLADLNTIENTQGKLAALNILVVSDIRPLRDALMNLLRKQKVFSLFVLEAGHAVNDLADSIDSSPIFIVRDREEALGIIRMLYRDPINTVKTAVNSEQVALRSLEGRPT